MKVCLSWMCVCVEKETFIIFPVSHSPFISHLFLTSHPHSMLAVCRFLSHQGPFEVSPFISLSFFFFLSVICKLIPHMQSHFLFLRHRINKFIGLAFRYIVFSLVLFPNKSCLFKSCTASYIT